MTDRAEWTVYSLKAFRCVRENYCSGRTRNFGEILFYVALSEDLSIASVGTFANTKQPGLPPEYTLFFRDGPHLLEPQFFEPLAGNIPILADSPVPQTLFISYPYVYVPGKRGVFKVDYDAPKTKTLVVMEQF